MAQKKKRLITKSQKEAILIVLLVFSMIFLTSYGYKSNLDYVLSFSGFAPADPHKKDDNGNIECPGNCEFLKVDSFLTQPTGGLKPEGPGGSQRYFAAARHLLISEITFSPSQYIEIYNPSNEEIDLAASGYYLTDGSVLDLSETPQWNGPDCEMQSLICDVSFQETHTWVRDPDDNPLILCEDTGEGTLADILTKRGFTQDQIDNYIKDLQKQFEGTPFEIQPAAAYPLCHSDLIYYLLDLEAEPENYSSPTGAHVLIPSLKTTSRTLNKITGKAVGDFCTSHADCGDKFCNPGVKICTDFIYCTAHADCGGYVCDSTTSKCVQCLSNVNCPGRQCIDNVCHEITTTSGISCTSHEDCGADYCNYAGSCVECLRNLHCEKDEKCTSNTCELDIDLTAEISISTSRPIKDEELTITVKVKNEGKATSPSTTFLQVKAEDSQSFISHTIGKLESKETYYYDFTHTYTTLGPRTITVVISQDNTVTKDVSVYSICTTDNDCPSSKVCKAELCMEEISGCTDSDQTYQYFDGKNYDQKGLTENATDFAEDFCTELPETAALDLVVKDIFYDSKYDFIKFKYCNPIKNPIWTLTKERLSIGEFAIEAKTATYGTGSLMGYHVPEPGKCLIASVGRSMDLAPDFSVGDPVTITLDSGNLIYEVFEDNNVFTKNVYSPLPDMIVNNIIYKPGTYDGGIQVEFCNIGEGTYIPPTEDDIYFAIQVEAPSIDLSSSLMGYRVPDPGKCSLVNTETIRPDKFTEGMKMTVTLDHGTEPNSLIPESDKINNALTKNVYPEDDPQIIGLKPYFYADFVLQEQFCDFTTGSISSETVNCENGLCSEGACVECVDNSDCPKQGDLCKENKCVPSCHDNDITEFFPDGKNIYLEGTIENLTVIKWDFCLDDTSIVEYFCDETNAIQEETISCPLCHDDRCYPCTEDSHCIDEQITKMCNPDTNYCVECLIKEDCNEASQAADKELTCNYETGRCVECFWDEDCDEDYHCHPDSGTCVSCLDDKHCPLNMICNIEVGQCVGCIEDTDCPQGLYCSSTQACVECEYNEDCREDETCELGSCVFYKEPTIGYYLVTREASLLSVDLGDFLVKFPPGSKIAPGETITVSVSGSEAFLNAHGQNPDYELFEDGLEFDTVPDMIPLVLENPYSEDFVDQYLSDLSPDEIKPDLTPALIQFTQEAEGDVTARATIRNVGYITPETDCEVYYLIKNEELDKSKTGTLEDAIAPGHEIILSVSGLETQAGINTFILELDTADCLEEIDEDNNDISQVVYIEPVYVTGSAIADLTYITSFATASSEIVSATRSFSMLCDGHIRSCMTNPFYVFEGDRVSATAVSGLGSGYPYGASTCLSKVTYIAENPLPNSGESAAEGWILTDSSLYNIELEKTYLFEDMAGYLKCNDPATGGSGTCSIEIAEEGFYLVSGCGWYTAGAAFSATIPARCSSDNHCITEAPKCNLDHLLCVQCTSNEDCSMEELCVNGACTTDIDLSISDIKIMPEIRIMAGDKITIEVTIDNLGTVVAENFNVKIGSYTDRIPELAPDSFLVIEKEFEFSYPGDQTMDIQITPPDVNNDNNDYTFTIPIHDSCTSNDDCPTDYTCKSRACMPVIDTCIDTDISFEYLDGKDPYKKGFTENDTFFGEDTCLGTLVGQEGGNAVDLIVKDIYYQAPYILKVRYCNYGTANSDSSAAMGVEVGTQDYHKTITIPIAGDCALTEVQTNAYKFLDGDAVTATVDRDDVVPESNEDNNVLTKNIFMDADPSITPEFRGKSIEEYYCEDNIVKKEISECPSNNPICTGGKCLECIDDDSCIRYDEGCTGTTEECTIYLACKDNRCVERCTDTDVSDDYPNGNSSFVSGIVENLSMYVSDNCVNDTTLQEYYCVGDDIKAENQTCTVACEYGHCIECTTADDCSDGKICRNKRCKEATVTSSSKPIIPPELDADSETLVLFYWDGYSPLVKDVDYVQWGTREKSIDKSGVRMGAEAYPRDTAVDKQSVISPIGLEEKPDLAPISIEFIPIAPLPDSLVTAKITLRNLGGVPADPTRYSKVSSLNEIFYSINNENVGNSEKTDLLTQTLEPGEDALIFVPDLPVVAGPNTFSFMIDQYNYLDESNKENNQLSEILIVSYGSYTTGAVIADLSTITGVVTGTGAGVLLTSGCRPGIYDEEVTYYNISTAPFKLYKGETITNVHKPLFESVFAESTATYLPREGSVCLNGPIGGAVFYMTQVEGASITAQETGMYFLDDCRDCGVVISTFSAAIPITCTSDDDCPDLKCNLVRQRCVECSTNTDCAEDEVCIGGSCVQPQCIDDDKTELYETGLNPYTKGTVTFEDETNEDNCLSGDQLIEYYCSQNDIETQIFFCEEGCSEGECLGVPREGTCEEYPLELVDSHSGWLDATSQAANLMADKEFTDSAYMTQIGLQLFFDDIDSPLKGKILDTLLSEKLETYAQQYNINPILLLATVLLDIKADTPITSDDVTNFKDSILDLAGLTLDENLFLGLENTALQLQQTFDSCEAGSPMTIFSITGSTILDSVFSVFSTSKSKLNAGLNMITGLVTAGSQIPRHHIPITFKESEIGVGMETDAFQVYEDEWACASTVRTATGSDRVYITNTDTGNLAYLHKISGQFAQGAVCYTDSNIDIIEIKPGLGCCIQITGRILQGDSGNFMFKSGELGIASASIPWNCNTDADCGEEHCKRATGYCVECLDDDDCHEDKFCHDNICVDKKPDLIIESVDFPDVVIAGPGIPAINIPYTIKNDGVARVKNQYKILDENEEIEGLGGYASDEKTGSTLLTGSSETFSGFYSFSPEQEFKFTITLDTEEEIDELNETNNIYSINFIPSKECSTNADCAVGKVCEEIDPSLSYLPSSEHFEGTPKICITPPACSDTDTGLDYYTQGTASNSSSSSSEDKCLEDSNILTEYYCDGDDIKSEDYTCPDACLGGTCSVAGTAIQITPETAATCAIYDYIPYLIQADFLPVEYGNAYLLHQIYNTLKEELLPYRPCKQEVSYSRICGVGEHNEMPYAGAGITNHDETSENLAASFVKTNPSLGSSCTYFIPPDLEEQVDRILEEVGLTDTNLDDNFLNMLRELLIGSAIANLGEIPEITATTVDGQLVLSIGDEELANFDVPEGALSGTTQAIINIKGAYDLASSLVTGMNIQDLVAGAKALGFETGDKAATAETFNQLIAKNLQIFDENVEKVGDDWDRFWDSTDKALREVVSYSSGLPDTQIPELYFEINYAQLEATGEKIIDMKEEAVRIRNEIYTKITDLSPGNISTEKGCAKEGGVFEFNNPAAAMLPIKNSKRDRSGKCWLTPSAEKRYELNCKNTGGTFIVDAYGTRCECPKDTALQPSGLCGVPKKPPGPSEAEQKICELSGGIWSETDSTCTCNKPHMIYLVGKRCGCTTGFKFNFGDKECKVNEETTDFQACYDSGGTWDGTRCNCYGNHMTRTDLNVCECIDEYTFKDGSCQLTLDVGYECEISGGTWTGSDCTGCDGDHVVYIHKACGCEPDYEMVLGRCVLSEETLEKQGDDCEDSGGDWVNNACWCTKSNTELKSNGKCDCKTGFVPDPNSAGHCIMNQQTQEAKEKCESGDHPGTWNNLLCTCPYGYEVHETTKKCVMTQAAADQAAADQAAINQEACTASGGKWENSRCECRGDDMIPNSGYDDSECNCILGYTLTSGICWKSGTIGGAITATTGKQAYLGVSDQQIGERVSTKAQEDLNNALKTIFDDIKKLNAKVNSFANNIDVPLDTDEICPLVQNLLYSGDSDEAQKRLQDAEAEVIEAGKVFKGEIERIAGKGATAEDANNLLSSQQVPLTDAYNARLQEVAFNYIVDQIDPDWNILNNPAEMLPSSVIENDPKAQAIAQKLTPINNDQANLQADANNFAIAHSNLLQAKADAQQVGGMQSFLSEIANSELSRKEGITKAQRKGMQEQLQGALEPLGQIIYAITNLESTMAARYIIVRETNSYKINKAIKKLYEDDAVKGQRNPYQTWERDIEQCPNAQCAVPNPDPDSVGEECPDRCESLNLVAVDSACTVSGGCLKCYCDRVEAEPPPPPEDDEDGKGPEDPPEKGGCKGTGPCFPPMGENVECYEGTEEYVENNPCGKSGTPYEKKPYCHPVTHKCVKCLEPAHCPTYFYCSPYTHDCVPTPPTEPAAGEPALPGLTQEEIDCDYLGLDWDSTTNVCVCRLGTSCAGKEPSEFCFIETNVEGQCVNCECVELEPVCTEPAKRCNPNEATKNIREVCTAAGQWKPEEDCTSISATCENGICIGEECGEDHSKCGAGLLCQDNKCTKPETCNDLEQRYGYAKCCDEDECYGNSYEIADCSNSKCCTGKCGEPPCTKGEKRCHPNTNEREICNDNQIFVLQKCELPKVCGDGNCMLKTEVTVEEEAEVTEEEPEPEEGACLVCLGSEECLPKGNLDEEGCCISPGKCSIPPPEEPTPPEEPGIIDKIRDIFRRIMAFITGEKETCASDGGPCSTQEVGSLCEKDTGTCENPPDCDCIPLPEPPEGEECLKGEKRCYWHPDKDELKTELRQYCEYGYWEDETCYPNYCDPDTGECVPLEDLAGKGLNTCDELKQLYRSQGRTTSVSCCKSNQVCKGSQYSLEDCLVCCAGRCRSGCLSEWSYNEISEFVDKIRTLAATTIHEDNPDVLNNIMRLAKSDVIFIQKEVELSDVTNLLIGLTQSGTPKEKLAATIALASFVGQLEGQEREELKQELQEALNEHISEDDYNKYNLKLLGIADGDYPCDIITNFENQVISPLEPEKDCNSLCKQEGYESGTCREQCFELFYDPYTEDELDSLKARAGCPIKKCCCKPPEEQITCPDDAGPCAGKEPHNFKEPIKFQCKKDGKKGQCNLNCECKLLDYCEDGICVIQEGNNIFEVNIGVYKSFIDSDDCVEPAKCIRSCSQIDRTICPTPKKCKDGSILLIKGDRCCPGQCVECKIDDDCASGEYCDYQNNCQKIPSEEQKPGFWKTYFGWLWPF